jgi:hypothetical protein
MKARQELSQPILLFQQVESLKIKFYYGVLQKCGLILYTSFKQQNKILVLVTLSLIFLYFISARPLSLYFHLSAILYNPPLSTKVCAIVVR